MSYVIESDPDIEAVERLPDGALVLAGSFSTVAGLMLERLGHIPTVGETCELAGRQVTILEVESRSISRLRIERAGNPKKHHRTGGTR